MPLLSNVYLRTNLDDNFECGLIRFAPLPRVLFQLKIGPTVGRNFDEHRLAIAYIDGAVAFDFCAIKALGVLFANLNPTDPPFFVSGKADISGVVWHGLPSEGTGVIGKLLHAREVSFRIYFEDLSIQDIKVSSFGLAHLQEGISSKILRS